MDHCKVHQQIEKLEHQWPHQEQNIAPNLIKIQDKFSMESAKRPTVTLMELLARTGYFLQDTTISDILHTSGLEGRVTS